MSRREKTSHSPMCEPICLPTRSVERERNSLARPAPSDARRQWPRWCARGSIRWRTCATASQMRCPSGNNLHPEVGTQNHVPQTIIRTCTGTPIGSPIFYIIYFSIAAVDVGHEGSVMLALGTGKWVLGLCKVGILMIDMDGASLTSMLCMQMGDQGVGAVREMQAMVVWD
ncbi:hypothetical protein M758_4G008100 [Ceratodon purpureus]|uniref:Uncharacterized protein n=1 Tax=Ceratodon purpureus TaxID=3225 RepID=A0A8T0I578_CERPU|nr:hypothetical protein KC19_4G008700 [Ceratodon purpureus]KAG0617692.1 hypothetical protein M758_4G008100 [Ceratodon purpureus]